MPTRTHDGTGGGTARGPRPDELAQRLADDIVNGRLTPGHRLEELELAARFGVSRTPVREALQLLGATGLIERRPNRGAIVASLGGQRLAERFEVMAELEAVCARLSAERMTPRERIALEALHRDTAALVRDGDGDAYEAANRAFHAAIYRGAHNADLEDTVQAARRRVAPFRRAQFGVLGRLAGSWAEHDRVVRAILAGDGDGAARAMRAHLTEAGAASAGLVARAPQPADLPQIVEPV